MGAARDVEGAGASVDASPNASTSAAQRCVTRIACFKFKAWVSAADKGGRTGACESSLLLFFAFWVWVVGVV